MEHFPEVLLFCFKVVAETSNNAVKQSLMKVDISEIPSILPTPTLVTATVGNIMELRCHAIGYPLPTYRWMKNGNIGLLSHSVQLDSGYLMIHNVEMRDEGNYTCMASNSAGADTRTWQVITQGW